MLSPSVVTSVRLIYRAQQPPRRAKSTHASCVYAAYRIAYLEMKLEECQAHVPDTSSNDCDSTNEACAAEDSVIAVFTGEVSC